MTADWDISLWGVNADCRKAVTLIKSHGRHVRQLFCHMFQLTSEVPDLLTCSASSSVILAYGSFIAVCSEPILHLRPFALRSSVWLLSSSRFTTLVSVLLPQDCCLLIIIKEYQILHLNWCNALHSSASNCTSRTIKTVSVLVKASSEYWLQ